MNVLVVVAHSDDETFFMGGEIARLKSEKSQVTVAVLSDGVGARPGTDHVRRLRSFQAAGKALGFRPIQRDVFRDQRSDEVPQLEINRAVELLMAAQRPDVVYTHHVGDLNIDHRRVSEAVLVATRPGSSTTRQVLCMTPEWPDRCVGPAWCGDIVRTVKGKLLDAKLRAAKCYRDELRQYPHPRSLRRIREVGAEWFMEIR